MRPKVLRISAIVALAAAALLIVIVEHGPARHRFPVKAYFSNGAGLREGAPVRIAGVDVGFVKSVRVRPELGQEPVEVEMILNPLYEIKIPSDSTVSLETAGVLGATYAEINTVGTSGPPLGPNAILKAQHNEQMNAQQFLESVSKVLEKKNCGCADQNEKAERNPPPTKRSTLSR